MYAPDGWKIKLHISYIHYYREWLCNGRCVSTGWSKLELLLNRLLALQFTECKGAIKDNYHTISQGNKTSLFVAMNWTLLKRPTPPIPPSNTTHQSLICKVPMSKGTTTTKRVYTTWSHIALSGIGIFLLYSRMCESVHWWMTAKGILEKALHVRTLLVFFPTHQKGIQKERC